MSELPIFFQLKTKNQQLITIFKGDFMERILPPIPERLENEPYMYYLLFADYCSFDSIQEIVDNNIHKFSRSTIFNISKKFNWKERKAKYDEILTARIFKSYGRSVMKNYESNFAKNIKMFENLNRYMGIFNREIDYELENTNNFGGYNKYEKEDRIKEFAAKGLNLLKMQKIIKKNLEDAGFGEKDIDKSKFDTDLDGYYEESEQFGITEDFNDIPEVDMEKLYPLPEYIESKRSEIEIESTDVEVMEDNIENNDEDENAEIYDMKDNTENEHSKDGDEVEEIVDNRIHDYKKAVNSDISVDQWRRKLFYKHKQALINEYNELHK